MTGKKLVRLGSLILCLVMLVTVFAGCGKTNEPTQGNTTSQSTSTTSPSASTAKTPANFNLSGYPIVNDKITLKFMISKSPTHGEFAEMAHFKEMEKLTNIHIEFNSVDSTAWEEKKNLALASGDLPDVFYSGISVKDESMYGEQGKLIIPLNKLIDQYMPHFKKMMVEYPTTKPAITHMDGNIYTLPYLADTLTVAHSTLYVRGDWMAEANIKMPKTLDEFYNMLVKFKARGADVIPVVPHIWDTFKLYMINAFGDHVDFLYGKDKNDKVVFVPGTEQYKRMLEFLNKLYTEKLLDNEVFTQKQEQAIAKGTEGKAGTFTFGTSLKPTLFKSGKLEVELLQPVTSQWNSKQHIQGRYPLSLGNGAITKVNKYPEATMRWLDVGYSVTDVDPQKAPGLDCLSMWLGIRGVHWDYTTPDKTKYSRKMPADSKISEVEWSTRYVSYGWGPCRLVAMFMPDNNPGQEMKATQSQKNWFPFTELGLPDGYLRYTADEQSKLNTLQTDIETYYKTMEANFITGKEPLANWSKYTDQLKKMNVDQLVALKQTAYERYLKNK